MSSTFGYHDGRMVIDSKLYSDFGAHLPLIRSFSLGKNWPPEYPFFAGEPIRYHYLFYFLVGNLEKIGLRLDLALNILSSFGMTLLLWLIYKITTMFAKSRLAGLLAIVLFLFNGSLAFVEYFNQQGWTLTAFLAIPSQVNFASFGPWSGRLVSAFWNLNIYTNQRHLALSFALVLLGLYPLLVKVAQSQATQKLAKTKFSLKNILKLRLEKIRSLFTFHKIDYVKDQKKADCIWLYFGLVSLFFIMPLMHQAGYMILVYLSFCLLLFYQNIFSRSLKLVYILSIALSFLSFKFFTTGSDQPVEWVLGYLVADKTILGLLGYWFYNLGLYLLLWPVLLFATLRKKNFLLLFISGLFVAANLWCLSPDMINNHKLLNFFMIGLVMATAGFFAHWGKKTKLGLIVLIMLFLSITFSGFLDLFPIINDYSGETIDYPQSDIQRWLMDNTLPNGQFLTASYLHSPASLVGRRLYLDYGYHAWSMGYDDSHKRALLPELWAKNISESNWCDLASSENLNYILVGPAEKAIEDGKIKIESSLILTKLPPTYVSLEGWRVWDVGRICGRGTMSP